MKTLQEVRNSNYETFLDNIIEFKDHRVSDPPMLLLLKRKAIRIFPGGGKVALYRNDKLGIDISIPYNQADTDNRNIAGITAEEADSLFETYTDLLKKNYETGSRFTDHPEFSKMRASVINKYGKEACEQLHLASEHVLNGEMASAARHFNLFEEKSKMGLYEEFVDENESEFIAEAAIHSLHQISKSKQDGTVIHKNGSQSKVGYAQAAHIMKLHSMCTPENKQKVEKLINDSPAGLTKVADFCSEHLP